MSNLCSHQVVEGVRSCILLYIDIPFEMIVLNVFRNFDDVHFTNRMSRRETVMSRVTEG